VAAARRAAERAPDAEVRTYPIGHFDIYLGAPFEQAISDQLSFLARHARARAGEPALASSR
jgi:hypothetical protein